MKSGWVKVVGKEDGLTYLSIPLWFLLASRYELQLSRMDIFVDDEQVEIPSGDEDDDDDCEGD